MSDQDPLLGTPPSDEETEAARRLADSLESGVPGDADPRTLAVVNLIRELSGGSTADASCAARTRAELLKLASGLPSRDEESFTAEEAEEARRLAGALESGTSGDADSRALAVSRLLEGLSGELPGDELAARRLRKELVSGASRARFLKLTGRLAAAAALIAVALSGVLLLRSPSRPSEQLLAQREAAAREAFSNISAPGSRDWGYGRVSAQLDELRAERFASTLRKERLTTLLGDAEETSSANLGGGSNQPPMAAHDSGGAS